MYMTPLWFLDRAALIRPNKTSLLHGPLCYTWRETYNRCRRLASSLSKHSIGLDSTVHAFLVVIACYSYLSVWFLRETKKKKNIALVFFMLLWIFKKWKGQIFWILLIYYYFLGVIQFEINKYMVILVCADRLAVLELYEC